MANQDTDLRCYLTNAGIAAENNSIQLGRKLPVKEMVFGSGLLADGSDPRLQTTMIQEEYAVACGMLFDPENPTLLIFKGDLPADVGGFHINEVSIRLEDGTLYNYARGKGDYKPTIEQGATDSVRYAVEMYTTNASIVECKVDLSKVYVDWEDLEVRIKAHTDAEDPHPQYLTKEQFNNEIPALKQQWSEFVNYAAGYQALVSDQRYVAVQPSGPNNGGAVEPNTDADWSHWKPVWALTQVENRLKANQNWNIPGRTGQPLPDATPRDYPAGAEIAYGIFVFGSQPVVNATYVEGVFSANSGVYFINTTANRALSFYGLKDANGRVIIGWPEGSTSPSGVGANQNGTTLNLVVNLNRLITNGIPRGAHKFAGCSELPGIWPDVNDEDSINAAMPTLLKNRTRQDLTAGRVADFTYTNTEKYEIEVSAIATPAAGLQLELYINNELYSYFGATPASVPAYSVSAEIQPGETYKVKCLDNNGDPVAIAKWKELR